MGRSLDYTVARRILEEQFPAAEEMFRNSALATIPGDVTTSTLRLFSSATRAFREALVGVVLARIIDPEIDIRFPYMNQAENSFNGRTLDSTVVNPFLMEHQIPCSTGPYLSSIRRNVTFEEATQRGVRDKAAFRALLSVIAFLQANTPEAARQYLTYLLSRFVALREASNIPLTTVHRLSLEQHEILIRLLLDTPSGGLLPVLLSVAVLSTIRDHFGLKWDIGWQGINVADRSTGAGGDITIREGRVTVLTIEVTERPIEHSRVVGTFSGKISPARLDDYLFLFTADGPADEARAVARQYFAQGHDLSFVKVKDWMVAILATVGPRGRALFFDHTVNLLTSPDVPAVLKLAWNENIRRLLSGDAEGSA